MAANYVLDHIDATLQRRDLTFAGDGVRLSGQLDYPQAPLPIASGYPLIFTLHNTGWNIRSDYDHYALIALRCGYAVFRWDKRGTGRSGAGGIGSTTQDAVLAYETALAQPSINRNAVVILAQNEGSLMLGEAFGLFARIQHPAGVILAGNMLDEKAILAINSRLLIVQGEKDWNRWQNYAQNAAATHASAYSHGAKFYVAPDANRSLMMSSGDQKQFHLGARHSIRDWLLELCPPFKSI